MAYSMSKLPVDTREEEKEKSLVALVQDTTRTAILSGNLANLVRRKLEGKRADERAKRAVDSVMKELGARAEIEEATEAEGFLMKLVRKMLVFVAKKVVKYIVRPVLRFAARIAMNLVRFALRAVVTWVIEPIIAAIAAFVVANPITAIIAGAFLAAGAGYWIWSQFFKEKAPVPPVTRAEDTANIAETEEDETYGPQARIEAPVMPPAQKYEKGIAEYIKAPVIAFKRETARKELAEAQALPVGAYKAPTAGKGKFEGFGEDVDAYIKEASQMFGLPEDILRGFVKMEAGWTGKMSPTGAIGTGQFIQSTWDSLAATAEGKAIGMTKIGNRFRTPEDPRFDKRINTLATALLAKNNAVILQKNGLPLTGENLYMLHNIGPGIIDVMLGRPATPSVLLAMKQNGMLEGQSASEFLAYQKGRFSAQYVAANVQPKTTAVATADKPTMKEGVTIDKKVPVTVPTNAPTRATIASDGESQKDIIKGPGKTIVKVA